MQNRNKTIKCDVCSKFMRSDHLKRHKETHKDLLSLHDDEIKEELKTRQEIKKKQAEKLQRIQEIAQENELEIPEEYRNRESVDYIDNVCTRCLRNHQLYLEKIELGKQVATIIESGEVIYDSLGKRDKEAFETYRRYFKVDISSHGKVSDFSHTKNIY